MECPNCGKDLETHDNVTGEKAIPQEGDAAICLYCGSALIFGLDKFIMMTEEKEKEYRKEIRNYDRAVDLVRTWVDRNKGRPYPLPRRMWPWEK